MTLRKVDVFSFEGHPAWFPGPLVAHDSEGDSIPVRLSCQRRQGFAFLPVGWYDSLRERRLAVPAEKGLMKSKSRGIFAGLPDFAAALIVARASEAEIAAAARDGQRTAAIALVAQRLEPTLMQNCRMGPPLCIWACRSDDLELVSLLIDAKADVNAADPDGITPLALACANANVDDRTKTGRCGREYRSR